MKNRTLCALLCFLCVLLTGCKSGAISSGPDASATDTETTAPSSPEKTNDGVLKEVSGTVYDGTINNITLITDDRQIYSFEKDDSLVETSEDGIIIGYPIIVGYYGELDDSQQSQTVQVASIHVSNFDGLTAEEEARHLLLTLTLEEEVGQMFIVRCPNEDAAEAVSKYQFGGYILYSDDFEGKTVDEVTSNIESYQSSARIPMLIGVDEEGGTVNRISLYSQFRSEPFESPKVLYAEGGWDSITSDTVDKCTFLKSLGINLNFAPVCDVSINTGDYIYSRSFGKNAEQTSTYVETVVAAMNGTGVGCVLKHFPGYGSNVDTHTGIANDNRSYDTFVLSDFLPFETGISAGAGAVLVCHNIVNCIDSEYPASLSSKVHSILRDDLGFSGVIITDDLSMDAIKDFTGSEEAAVLAIEAGNDMLCCRYYEAQITAVIDAVESGEITLDRIDESVMRVLEWKIKLGII